MIYLAPDPRIQSGKLGGKVQSQQYSFGIGFWGKDLKKKAKLQKLWFRTGGKS